MRTLTLVLMMALITSCGGGDKGNETVDGGLDGAVESCEGMSDGTPCGVGEICLNEACVSSICGDGYVDSLTNEECDDGNFVDGDGCDTDCTLSCYADEDCSDGNPCNGEEICSPTLNRCQSGEPPTCDDEDDCTADSCDESLGCVHEFIDEDLDGYSPFDCNPDGDYAGMGGDCNDDPTDGGGLQNPGLGELCGNGIDDDCNGLTDGEDPDVNTFCYRDEDGDGFPDESQQLAGCACPAGYMAPRSDGHWDCNDKNPDAHPQQTSYFDAPHCQGVSGTATWELSCSGGNPTPICIFRWVCPNGGSSPTFDYNCDGNISRRYTAVDASTCTLSGGGGPLEPIRYCTGTGWTGSTAPSCGFEGELLSCGGFRSCNSSTGNQTQTCR